MFSTFDIPPGFLPAQSEAEAPRTPGLGTSEQAIPHNTTGQADITTQADPVATSPAVGIMRWVIAWAVVLLLLGLLNRTRLGHTLIYYALALMLLLLVVTQYKWFANVLQPITGHNDTYYQGPVEEQAAPRTGHSWNIPQIAQSESGAISQ
ncbi:MAG: hypothetical protein ACXWQZ_24990 [Ktedonobacterales bacterium]